MCKHLLLKKIKSISLFKIHNVHLEVDDYKLLYIINILFLFFKEMKYYIKMHEVVQP